MDIIAFIKNPWHWSVAGILIGLTVPILLLLGNKHFGISSNLRHVCAICMPANIPYFKYNWKKESWNLFFVAGILIGSFIASTWLTNPNVIEIADGTRIKLLELGITEQFGLMPTQIFVVENIFSLKGLIFFVLGGFLIGFGTRYANGCTSGHSIAGLANLNKSSFIATICFMVGGFISANLFIPFILELVF